MPSRKEYNALKNTLTSGIVALFTMAKSYDDYCRFWTLINSVVNNKDKLKNAYEKYEVYQVRFIEERKKTKSR